MVKPKMSPPGTFKASGFLFEGGCGKGSAGCQNAEVND
jgi:hypothetical protein